MAEAASSENDSSQVNFVDPSEGNSQINGVDLTGSDSFLLMSYLDEVEDRVEELRRQALSLSQEKDSLLTIISQLKDDRLKCCLTKDESIDMLANIEHLKKRCEAVEINIKTPRTTEQESSYMLVDSLVTELEHVCWLGNTDSQTCVQAKSYFNACVSDASSDGPVDYTFQGMILGCSLTDQKLVKQRLQSLVKGKCNTDFTAPSLHYPKQLPSRLSPMDDKHQPDHKSHSSHSEDP